MDPPQTGLLAQMRLNIFACGQGKTVEVPTGGGVSTGSLSCDKEYVGGGGELGEGGHIWPAQLMGLEKGKAAKN